MLIPSRCIPYSRGRSYEIQTDEQILIQYIHSFVEQMQYQKAILDLYTFYYLKNVPIFISLEILTLHIFFNIPYIDDILRYLANRAIFLSCWCTVFFIYIACACLRLHVLAFISTLSIFIITFLLQLSFQFYELK